MFVNRRGVPIYESFITCTISGPRKCTIDKIIISSSVRREVLLLIYSLFCPLNRFNIQHIFRCCHLFKHSRFGFRHFRRPLAGFHGMFHHFAIIELGYVLCGDFLMTQDSGRGVYSTAVNCFMQTIGMHNFEPTVLTYFRNVCNSRALTLQSPLIPEFIGMTLQFFQNTVEYTVIFNLKYSILETYGFGKFIRIYPGDTMSLREFHHVCRHVQTFCGEFFPYFSTPRQIHAVSGNFIENCF